MTNCSHCGVEVFLAITPSGKEIFLDQKTTVVAQVMDLGSDANPKIEDRHSGHVAHFLSCTKPTVFEGWE